MRLPHDHRRKVTMFACVAERAWLVSEELTSGPLRS